MRLRRVGLACTATLLIGIAPGFAPEDEIVWIDRFPCLLL